MAGSQVPGKRATDADRDRAVRRLRDAAVDGRLSQDSFIWRIDLALRAKNHQELGSLMGDLASKPNVLARLRSDLMARRRPSNGTPPALEALALPERHEPVLIVGRQTDCDFILRDPTVSRVHAVLMLYGGQWLLHDRQSTNGTRVNGRRVWGATVVHPGDSVSFGRMSFRLQAPRPTRSERLR